MSGYNKIQMMGRLSSDTEHRTTAQKGTSVVEFSMAVDSGWGNNKKTCFINCTVWGKQADFVSQYFSKGDPIFIEGRLDFERWDDKTTGNKRSRHKITVERVMFTLGSNKKPPSGEDLVSNDGPAPWNSAQNGDSQPPL